MAAPPCDRTETDRPVFPSGRYCMSDLGFHHKGTKEAQRPQSEPGLTFIPLGGPLCDLRVFVVNSCHGARPVAKPDPDFLFDLTGCRVTRLDSLPGGLRMVL